MRIMVEFDWIVSLSDWLGLFETCHCNLISNQIPFTYINIFIFLDLYFYLKHY